jgi:hypothetical protein
LNDALLGQRGLAFRIRLGIAPIDLRPIVATERAALLQAIIVFVIEARLTQDQVCATTDRVDANVAFRRDAMITVAIPVLSHRGHLCCSG